MKVIDPPSGARSAATTSPSARHACRRRAVGRRRFGGARASAARARSAAGELTVAGLAHFNHQLACDDAADRDEAVLRRRSARRSAGRFSSSAKTSARAPARDGDRSKTRRSAARHEFFERARGALRRRRRRASATRATIRPKRFCCGCCAAPVRAAWRRCIRAVATIIRPLLECRRADLRAYLGRARMRARRRRDEQRTSASRATACAPSCFRCSRTRFNPASSTSSPIRRSSRAHEWSWMESEQIVGAVSKRSREPGAEPGTLVLPRAPLSSVRPSRLRRLAVWRAMTRAAGGRPVSFRHVEAALQLIELHEPRSGQRAVGVDGSIDAPGHSVERIGATHRLKSRAPTLGTARASTFRYPCRFPERSNCPKPGCVVSAEVGPAGAGIEALRATAGNRAVGRRGATAAARSPSEIGVPAIGSGRLGSTARRSCRTSSWTEKCARAARDGVPLVVDDSDRIVWVAGHEIDEAFRVTDASQAVVILTLRQV